MDFDFDHQKTLRSLEQSARIPCFICRRIWEDWLRNPRSKDPSDGGDDFPLVVAHITPLSEKNSYRLDFSLRGFGYWNEADRIGILLLQKTDGEKDTLKVTRSRSLNSPEVLGLAKSWVSACVGPGHKNCPSSGFESRAGLQRSSDGLINSKASGSSGKIGNPKFERPFYPTRLIELGPLSSTTVKLVVTSDLMHPNAENAHKPVGRYVTLSHCWGHAKFLTLTKSNVCSFTRDGIPLEKLTRTFQHAIDFARRLGSGVEYIWIDSLCIIQGDKPDWMHESTQMYDVYRNSFLNISATAAENGSQGLYVGRDPERLDREDVTLDVGVVSKPASWYPRILSKSEPGCAKTLTQRWNIVDPSHWNRIVDAAPVNTRGWVLQERLLAPRVLHFCKDQIAWECREFEASESCPAGIDLELNCGIIKPKTRFKDLMARKDGTKVSSSDAAAVASEVDWKAIVEKYSLLKLTQAKDKLVALAGIAGQMYPLFEAPYVAGMWNNKHFTSQLLWRVEPRFHKGVFSYPSRRPEVYRAPSFSWAAIDAPDGVKCAPALEETSLLIRMVRIRVNPEPESNSKFGLVQRNAYTDIACQKHQVAIDRKVRKTANGTREDIFTWTLVAGSKDIANMQPSVYLDSPEDDFEQIRSRNPVSSTWLVPAHRNSSGDLVCLLLQQIETGFRRVGLSVSPRYMSSGRGILGDKSAHAIGDVRRWDEEVIRIF
ncbi:uncharacterized protein L3040_001228 [Drepanopeziza brunnea f. sp. 'multigermtubi']|uniref:Heterokaryon incompatibility protein n=1 Tax=Marssonina brunnea f. sp. multigermtubi (strain MB_m1) TaxID=1072389 RepID=K1X759_MARBU|nr:heterokaryon incompatibility protein [Drepanopeziza brunnea f. sp. 'multigermtubi' MB_m1]EKD16493.1 heterokaryon incompatibility protein [Drepanopeziza brunnea f. sp. 'multigermtubi' MB_m1]KAJ5051451.1 hypothetical protein L3040_001228 [Drepanopeziza brunnea f. sp. 'multigermtubi']